jgi:peptide/nickel transport system substrate-binding protein
MSVRAFLVVPCLLVVCLTTLPATRARQADQSNPTGPNPPFQGAAPQNPFVVSGVPGVYGGTLRFAIEGNPAHFNALLASGTSTTDITQNFLFAPLVGYDPIEQQATNELITGCDVSPNGLVFTYHIRRGLRWSDGEPFTADDVVWNFGVIFDRFVENPNRDAFIQRNGSFPRVEKVDESTVRFTLNEVQANFHDAVGSVYLLPKHKLDRQYKAGEFDLAYDLDTDPRDIVGMGPYRVLEYALDQGIVLERNPYYWKVDSKGQRLPYIDRVTIAIVPDANAVTLKFLNGETDLLRFVRPDDIASLKDQEKNGTITVHDLGPSNTIDYIAFNQYTGKRPDKRSAVDPARLAWFRNTTFRQAISTAIDREGLAKTVFLGRGVPVYSIVSPANRVWYDDVAVVKRPYDLAKAKAMLASIGMKDRNGDGILEDATKREVRFSIMTNANNPIRVATTAYIKANLAKVGILVEVQDIDFNSLIAKLTDSHDWEAVVLGWQSAVPPDPALMRNILLSSGRNHTWFPSQKVPSTPWERSIDSLVAANGRTLDLKARKAAVSQILRIWTEQCAEIDLVARNWTVAATRRVQNLKPSVLPPYVLWNLDSLYLSGPPALRDADVPTMAMTRRSMGAVRK